MVNNKYKTLTSMLAMLFLVLSMPFVFASEISEVIPQEVIILDSTNLKEIDNGVVEPQGFWFIPLLSYSFLVAVWGYKAYKVWKQIKVVKKAIDTGKKLSGHKVWGSKTYKNYDKKLPNGNYKEYDVNPTPAGKSRDSERIVYDKNTGDKYYTPDHYDTFRKVD